MEQISTETLRRTLPDVLRQVVAGKSFEVVSYGKPVGVVLVERSKVELTDAEEAPME